ncbi:MAG TPA: hypothetical protein VD704_14025 [Gaiellaceae bacterium]|jgi:hypothetical protein|nr:hypothetical protein [Gaiellaceae bacterium]
MFGGRRQIEFPPQQTHVRAFELGMVLFCLVAIVFVVIMVVSYEGAFIGPW